MFENYFKLQPPTHNDDDLNNLLFKQLIVEAFTDNEVQFDKILNELMDKQISLFSTFTIYPQYTGSLESANEISIERNDSDYGSFIAASSHFIKNEKYVIKLIKNITHDEVLNNQEIMTNLILGLLDNSHKEAFKEIIDRKLLTEKEIKLKLILPERPYYYNYRKINFHTLEVDFLSEYIHELKINNSNMSKVKDIYSYVLSHCNSTQYKKLVNIFNHKIDFSFFTEYSRKEIFKVFLEHGVINENQIVGEKNLIISEQELTPSSIEIKSFLNLNAIALEHIKYLQGMHLEKRLKTIEAEREMDKTKIKKI